MDLNGYIGIYHEWLWILDMLHNRTNLGLDNIKLVLMKIRFNDSFSRLGDQFGLSTSQASRVFKNTLGPITHFLKTFVYCPDPRSVKQNLPIAFRAYYSNVYAIIDAFEVEIEKPSDPVHQALTWSEYKKCNTIKYLIACTPDGMIIFVSQGYGGRIPDTLLFEDCKIMDVLPKKCVILADRVFKNLETLLSNKGYEMFRPPSVYTAEKMSKEDVLKTKSIASLRIHVERVIGRVRDFTLLKPHSVVDLKLLPRVDDAVYAACSLINLQKPIIKK